MERTVLATRLTELRNKNGLSITELSRRLGVNYETYRAYEKRNVEPPVKVLKRIAEFYGVSMDYLMGLGDTDQDAYLKVSRISPLLADGMTKLSDDNIALIQEIVTALGGPEKREELMRQMRGEAGTTDAYHNPESEPGGTAD